MIGSHRWLETGKIAVLLGENHFKVEVKIPIHCYGTSGCRASIATLVQLANSK